MTPHLQHFDEPQAQDIRDTVHDYLRPFRIRFWIMMGIVLFGVPFTLFLYSTTQHQVNRQVCHNQAALHNLIILATIPRPGETTQQLRAGAVFRNNALRLVDAGNACPPPPPLSLGPP